MSLIRRRLLDDTIKKTASGNPIAVQSVARMRPGIKIFGRSTQDGTPSPDHPVPIVNAGEGGEITVYISGANLLDIDHIDFRPSESTGLTAQLLDDGTIQVSGTPAKAYATVCSDELSLPAGTYFISGGENADGKLYAQITIETGDTTAYYINKSFTITGEEDRIYFSVQTGSGLSYVDDYKIKPMINFGDTALPWGPYRELQDLPIQTPNGLPGIPVTSGGNYTDADGQQWVCDEIDFRRGKYVQRVKKFVATNDTHIASTNPFATNSLDTVQPFRVQEWAGEIIRKSKLMSENIKIESSWNRPTESAWTVEHTVDFNIYNERLGTNAETTRREAVAALKEWLVDNPLTFLCQLVTPIETDLTPEEIAAYKALHTYSPTTTVSNDADAWMKLTYKTRKGLEADA